MCVISGGAGTGKTFTVGKIAEIFEQAGAKVVFCAPTGKAAKRMEALSGRKAATIHRMLGYQGSRFTLDTDWLVGKKVDADLLVVDEFSMVDVLLLAQLLECVDPTRTTLLMVGDHHQLPPVGPGNALRDFIERRPLPVAILDEVVRQAGVLKERCRDVLKGEVGPSVWEKKMDGRIESPWAVIDRFAKGSEVGKYALELAGVVLPEKLGYKPEDVQFLAPMYKGPCGVDAINIGLQKLYQGKLGVKVPEVPEGKRPPLYVGDRVVQTRNNYELGVMNGTQGYVREVRPDGLLNVEFQSVDDPSGLECKQLGRDEMRDLTLAYCLTVHRSQGDQWPAVVAISHSAASHMLTRNLLYTAVTRAQTTAIVVGDSRGIRGAAAREEASKRRTWLGVLPLPRCG